MFFLFIRGGQIHKGRLKVLILDFLFGGKIGIVGILFLGHCLRVKF